MTVMAFLVLKQTTLERCVTKFEEPAFSVRVEEGVSQIIPIILWDFERLIANAVVEFLSRQELNG